MKYILPKRFTEELESFPISIQKKFWKQINYLLRDFRHSEPSLPVILSHPFLSF